MSRTVSSKVKGLGGHQELEPKLLGVNPVSFYGLHSIHLIGYSNTGQEPIELISKEEFASKGWVCLTKTRNTRPNLDKQTNLHKIRLQGAFVACQQGFVGPHGPNSWPKEPLNNMARA